MSIVCYIPTLEGQADDMQRWLDAVRERYGVVPVLLPPVSWNDDLTPWPAAPIFKKGKPFGGQADAYLDRLEKDEIYEVLRLIRNTAKFKNVIYIVAYDKEYICGTLGMKGITAPREYLMKIFQAEITLPVFEDSKLVELLIEELAIQLGDNDKGKLEIERMLMVNNQTSLPLSAVLRNFRDIKRFANLIALDIIHIEQGRNVYDIHVRDLFLLELIHYRYDSIYKLLLDDRGKLIKWDKDKGLYKCKDDAELPDDVKTGDEVGRAGRGAKECRA